VLISEAGPAGSIEHGPALQDGQAQHPALAEAAYEVASDLGILPALEQLEAAEKAESRETLHIIRLKQDTLEVILTASFEIRSALSRIERELAQTNELLSNMQERRERSVQKSEIANFMQSGTTEVLSTALADFTGRSGPLSIAGAILGAIGGSGEIGISSYSLKLNQGPKRSRPASPNMLSQLFGYTTESTRFPPGVWSYLNDVNPNTPGPGTRRANLIKEWVRLRRIHSPDTPEGKREIALLTGQIPQTRTVTLDLLQDRALMLSDLEAAVSQMDQEMLEIMRWLKYH